MIHLASPPPANVEIGISHTAQELVGDCRRRGCAGNRPFFATVAQGCTSPAFAHLRLEIAGVAFGMDVQGDSDIQTYTILHKRVGQANLTRGRRADQA